MATLTISTSTLKPLGERIFLKVPDINESHLYKGRLEFLKSNRQKISYS